MDRMVHLSFGEFPGRGGGRLPQRGCDLAAEADRGGEEAEVFVGAAGGGDGQDGFADHGMVAGLLGGDAAGLLGLAGAGATGGGAARMAERRWAEPQTDRAGGLITERSSQTRSIRVMAGP